MKAVECESAKRTAALRASRPHEVGGTRAETKRPWGRSNCSFWLEAYGEAAFCVYFEGPDEEEVWRATHLVGRRLQSLGCVLNAVPTYATIFVECELKSCGRSVLRDRIESVVSKAAATALSDRASHVFTVPVVYGGDMGPDLDPLAARLGMRPEDLVRAHTRLPLPIRCLAGPVGGPMMSGPEHLPEVPRQHSPRPLVKGGRAVLAGRQAFLKTMDGPSGWQVIGATPLKLIDIEDSRLVPWEPGDYIRFVEIQESEWRGLVGRRPDRDVL